MVAAPRRRCPLRSTSSRSRDEFLPLHEEILAPKASERRRMVGLELPRRPHRRRLDVPCDRHGGVRLRRDDHQRVGLARGDPPRRHRAPRPGGLDRRPPLHTAGVGTEPRPPLQLSRGAFQAGRPRARALRSNQGAARARRPRPRSCSSTPPSCTTSGSTWRTTGTIATLPTSSSTEGCAASPRRRSRRAAIARWRRRGDRATEELGPLGPGGEERLRNRPRSCASPTASTGAAARRSTTSMCTSTHRS